VLALRLRVRYVRAGLISTAAVPRALAATRPHSASASASATGALRAGMCWLACRTLLSGSPCREQPRHSRILTTVTRNTARSWAFGASPRSWVCCACSACLGGLRSRGSCGCGSQFGPPRCFGRCPDVPVYSTGRRIRRHCSLRSCRRRGVRPDKVARATDPTGPGSAIESSGTWRMRLR
jgi:hypothetical protein